jgi:hypothetical protein
VPHLPGVISHTGCCFRLFTPTKLTSRGRPSAITRPFQSSGSNKKAVRMYSRDAYAVAQDAGEARSRDRIRNEREIASSREIVPMSEFRRSPLRRDGRPGQVFRATETLLTNGCGEMCCSVVRVTFETFALTICTPSIPRLMEQVATF